MMLMAAGLALVALPALVRGEQILLTWPSLGSGTTYYVQTSTNLRTWSNLVVTTATSANLAVVGTPARVFRLGASNAPPQSETVTGKSGSATNGAGNSNIPPQPVTIAWTPPGSSASKVAGYYLYYGTSTGNYTEQIDAGLNTSAVADDLLAGTTYYFATTAYTDSGLESGYSEEIMWPPLLVMSIQPAP